MIKIIPLLTLVKKEHWWPDALEDVGSSGKDQEGKDRGHIQGKEKAEPILDVDAEKDTVISEEGSIRDHDCQDY